MNYNYRVSLCKSLIVISETMLQSDYSVLSVSLASSPTFSFIASTKINELSW